MAFLLLFFLMSLDTALNLFLNFSFLSFPSGLFIISKLSCLTPEENNPPPKKKKN